MCMCISLSLYIYIYICMYVCMYVCIYIYIYIYIDTGISWRKSPRRGSRPQNLSEGALSIDRSEKGEVLLRGLGTLRYSVPPYASMQWQPGDLIIRTNKWLPGAAFLGAPPISLIIPQFPSQEFSKSRCRRWDLFRRIDVTQA